MTWFQAFRGEFGYAHYGEHRTSVTWDVPFAAIIYTCILISLAAIIAAAGIRGKERWYTLVRVIYSLLLGSIILVSIFGYCWQLGDVRVHAPYLYRSAGHVNGGLGIRIGLTTVNLTLKGTFSSDNSKFSYNEELQLEDVIRGPPLVWKALDQGLPQSLLSIIEYFDIDDGGLRFGRAVFMAGYFANILMWAAFSFWVTANILLCSVVWYGAACFSLTGVCMVLAAIMYHLLCPQGAVKMPCSDGVLKLTYGWCFWSSLIFGILTVVIGLILFMLEHKVPKKLAEFFLLDTTMEDVEDYKTVPSISIPDTTFTYSGSRKLTERSRSPGPCYLNYGYESSKTTTKGNPLHSDQSIDHDGSIRTVDSITESVRPRSFSNITEEDDVFEHPETSKERSKDIDAEKEIDRLSEIYIDVDARGTSKTLPVFSKPQPYMKDFDAKNSH
ncbi:hypothetical protein ACF0H5_011959 [Mactra antiquata]